MFALCECIIIHSSSGCSVSAVFNQCTNINITGEQVHQAVLIRGVAGSICFLFGVVALVFEIIFLCRRKANFLLRLFLYLTLSSTLFIGTFGLDLVHYFKYGRNGDDTKYCEVLAFLAVYMISVTSLFSCSIVFFLLRIVFNCTPFHIEKPRNGSMRCCGRFCIAEVAFVTATFLLPLFVCWLPFLNGHYGNNPWSYCWFTNGPEQDPCDMNTTIDWDELLIFFIPSSITALASFFCVILVIGWIIRLRCKTQKLAPGKMKVIAKEMFLFVGFMTAYSVTWLVFIVSSLTKPVGYSVYTFWVLKSLVNPVIVATIPSSYFFYLSAKCCSCSKKGRRLTGRHLYSTIANITAPPSSRVSASSITRPVPFSNSWESSEESDD